MPEISKIDGFDVGLLAQSPQFFDDDLSNVKIAGVGTYSLTPQFFTDSSNVAGVCLSVSDFNYYFNVTVNSLLK